MLQAGPQWEVRLEAESVGVGTLRGLGAYRGLKTGKAEKPPVGENKVEMEPGGQREGWRGATASGPIFRTMKRLWAASMAPTQGCRRPGGTRSRPPYMLCDPGGSLPTASPGSSAVKVTLLSSCSQQCHREP